MVMCYKLKKESPSLPMQPYPGELGTRIFNEISKEAWQMWLQHQTMLINEYRLNLMDQEARRFLAVEMEKFLFGEGSLKPAQFVAMKK